MRFWDASAVVPLIVSESESASCGRILADDTELIVWCLTPVEVTSALTRRLRENSLSLHCFVELRISSLFLKGRGRK